MNQNSQTNLTIGILVATVVAAGGTYFAFDFLTGDKGKTKAPAEAVSPEADAAPPAAATASQDPVSAATEAAVAAVSEGATGAGLSEAEARRIGEEVARQVAAQVAQSIVDQQLSKTAPAGDAAGGLTAEEARRIGEEEGRRVAQEVVQTALAAQAGKSSGGLSAAEAEEIGYAAGKRAAQQVAASTARRVVRDEFGGQVASSSHAPAAAAEQMMSNAEEATPAAAPTPPRAKPAKTAPKAVVAASDALKAWWPAPSGGFGLVYAGQPKGEAAIALLFSAQPGEGALSQSVKVYDQHGELVSGTWEAAANPRLAVFRGLKPGRYTVVVDASLADAQGQSLGQALHGPVYVI
ncbi:MAG: hypothetical protein EPN60_05910 [Nevskiaceae bacterium]|nr:MAG: hypothetical protein EPO48_15390 [Nevskiaceae bacterium]TAM29826.1 MAG: hypothetical protein EPN60_05910 [Nevskiaceae bacterium]